MAKGKKTGGGSRRGVPNKLTREFRDVVTKLLENNADNMGAWLDAVAQVDPGKALDLLCKLAEYAVPKLSRAEHVGNEGGPLHVKVVRFTGEP